MMDCSQSRPERRSVMDRIHQAARKEGVPLTGSIELTSACNLRCCHCYIPESELAQHMTTGTVYRILDQLADVGCLFLLLTGGEPLLRKDFAQIYTYAKDKGFLITVFTNGTLVSDEVVDLFRAMPPHSVEISLYGATEKTVEKITGDRGAFEACIAGLERLLDAGIDTKLKSVLMTLNRDEFSEIEALAAKYGVSFRMDSAILPKRDGDKTPTDFRVGARDAVDVEFADKKRREQWEKFSDRIVSPDGDEYLYSCGAGQTTFHISSSGMLQPCLMASEVQYDLTGGSFTEGWRKMENGIRGRMKGPENRCRRCDRVAYCGYCPPFFKLENDSFDICSDYLCDIGRYRCEQLAVGTA